MSDFITWSSAAMADGRVLLAMGCFAIGLGLLSRMAGGRWPFAMRSLRTKLVAWNVAPAGGVADAERQIGAYYRSLAATTAIAAGAAFVLAGLALAMLSWSGHRASSEPGVGIQWSTWLLYVALLVGTGLGFPLAVRLARRSRPAGPRYADLRQRRLADYRAPGLRWLAPSAVAVQAAAGAVYIVLQHAWLPGVLPALSALTVVLAELQMSATARVPRMVVLADPAAARRCDDLVRAGVVARLQWTLLVSVGFAAFLEASLALGPPHPRSAAQQVAIQMCLLCGLCSSLVAFGIGSLEERLGGTITGWSGRPMPK